MEVWEKVRTKRLGQVALFTCAGFLSAAGMQAAPEWKLPRQAQTAAAAAKPVGTIKAINGKSIVLTADGGAEVSVQVQDDAKLVRIAPGQTSLKDATPIQLTDLQPGDRILVRGSFGPDGKTVLAASVVSIKSADIAAKQTHERDEWQRHGVGGLVTNIEASTGTVTLSTNAQGPAKDVKVTISKQTVLRRYAADSVKFDDAKPAPIDQIRTGDQLRARGTRSADGSELAADEVVSGTFRNISGTVSSIDSAAGTLTVMDLVAKKNIIVKISADTQLRKLPPAIAQMIAVRLKGAPADGAAAAGGSAPGAAAPGAANATGGQAGQGGAQAGAARPGGAGGARGGDLQQALSRMPAATLADLQKGDAVMIVTTEGTQENGATAITLLAGVEPILQASPKGGASSILTPWSMSGAPGGDATP